MQPKRFIAHAPPCSLKDLFGPHLDVVRLGHIVAALPGSCEHGTKANEQWRYLLRGCWVIGYKHSAVVAGDSPALIPLVAAHVRAAVTTYDLPPPVDMSVSQAPISPLLTVSSDDLLPLLDTPGATWEAVRDWSGEPWADAWIQHCRSQSRPARPMNERLAEPIDPYIWALREGYITR